MILLIKLLKIDSPILCCFEVWDGVTKHSKSIIELEFILWHKQ